MRMRFAFRILAICIILIPVICHAHADFIEIEVFELKNDGEEKFTLVFYATDGRVDGQRATLAKRKYIVHIRYDKNHLAIPATKKEYLNAIEFMKKQIDESSNIRIARMSGRGYIPIKNRPGHYRTEALKIVDYSKNGPCVLFIHSDRGHFSQD